MNTTLASRFFGLALAIWMSPIAAYSCVAEHLLAGVGQSYQTLLTGKGVARNNAAYHLETLLPSLDPNWLAAKLHKNSTITSSDLRRLLSRMMRDADRQILGAKITAPAARDLRILAEVMNGRCKRSQSPAFSMLDTEEETDPDAEGKDPEEVMPGSGGGAGASSGDVPKKFMQARVEDDNSRQNWLLMAAVFVASACLSYYYFFASLRFRVVREKRHPRRPFKARFGVQMGNGGNAEQMEAKGIDI